MRVTITKVHENVFSGEALSVSMMTGAGEITVLPNHEALVSNIKPGVVSVKTKEGTQNFEVSGGVLEVSNNQVTVLL
ncbi:F0F1 ATP synthase subunit epsilon [Patescibacteria group bacterium]|nr:F0F1 ATP synthase subunit epsilon [Patescibacteria group bacterium]